MNLPCRILALRSLAKIRWIRRPDPSRFLDLSLIAAGVLAWAGTVQAQVPSGFFWTNTASAAWSCVANWKGWIVADGAGNTANFATVDITGDVTVSLDSARTLGNLIFGDIATGTAAGWILDNGNNVANSLTLDGADSAITVNALGISKSVLIGAVVTGTNGLTKTGAGSLNLTNANTYTGTTTINAGALNVGDGTAGSLNGTIGTALTFSGTGTLKINEAAGVSQGMGALSFSGGDGTVQSTYGSGAAMGLTFASLAARSAGAAGNFVVFGGVNGTDNKIAFTTLHASQILDYGIFFGGSSYAAYDAGGYLRSLMYGTDNNASDSLTGAQTTLGTISTTNDVQYVGSVSVTTTTGYSNSNTLNVGNSALFTVGQPIAGTGIPANSFVVAINNATNVSVGGLGLPWYYLSFNSWSVASGTTVFLYNQVAAQTTAGLNTLDLDGPGATINLAASQMLTVNGILRSGGSSAIGAISGGAGIQAGNNQDLVVRTDTASDALVISTPILANGVNNLVKSGSGTLILYNPNGSGTTYTGKTFVNGGTLLLFRNVQGDSGCNVGAIPSSFQADNIVLQNDARLAYDQNIGQWNRLRYLTFEANRGIVLGPGMQIIERVGNLKMAINGVISGPGGLMYKSDAINDDGGGSTLDLGAANTYAGDTVFSWPGGQTKGGNLTINHSLALQNSTLNFVNTLGFPESTSRPNGILFNVATATFGGLKGGLNAGQTKNLALPGSSLAVGNNNQNTLYGGTMSGSGRLIKIGTGTLTLSNANTYSGGTTISNGTLLVNNTAGSGTGINLVTVKSGATLGGTGTVGGNISVEGGAVLAPGSGGIGTLIIASNLTVAGEAVLDWDYSPSTNDQVAVGGTLTLPSHMVMNVNVLEAGEMEGSVLYTYGAGYSGPARIGLTAPGWGGSFSAIHKPASKIIVLSFAIPGTVLMIK